MQTVDVNNLTKEQALKPPSESKTSIVLNGIGNGMMIGLLPFAFLETGYGIAGKSHSVPRGWHIFSAVAMVAGIVGGALFGSREADAVEEYRQNVGDEIIRLRAQNVENAKAIDMNMRNTGPRQMPGNWSSQVRQSQLEAEQQEQTNPQR